MSHFTQEGSKLHAQSTASSICKIFLAPRWSWKSPSKPSHYRVASSASSRSARRVFWRWVFVVADLAASRVLTVPIVEVAGGGERARWGGLRWGWVTRSRRGRQHRSGRRLSVQGSESGSSSRSLECTICVAAPLWLWCGEGKALVQSEQTPGDCTSESLQWWGGRVVQQIHEVQGTSGNKEDHGHSAEALSTVQHCWLQPCPR